MVNSLAPQLVTFDAIPPPEIGNLLPVTIGNIVRVMVAAVYWFVYLRKKLAQPSVTTAFT